MDRETWGTVAIIGSVVGLIVIFAMVCISIAWHGEHVDCKRLGEQTDYPTRMVGSWSGGGCYIYVDGRWIPDTRYRMVDVDI